MRSGLHLSGLTRRIDSNLLIRRRAPALIYQLVQFYGTSAGKQKDKRVTKDRLMLLCFLFFAYVIIGCTLETIFMQSLSDEVISLLLT